MEYAIKSGTPEKQRIACVVVPIFSGKKLSKPAKVIDDASDGGIKQHLKRGDFSGARGQVAWLYQLENTFCERLLLVGCGAEREVDSHVFREICETTAKALNQSGAAEAISYLTAIECKHLDQMQLVRATVLNFEASLYRFDTFKSEPETIQRPLRRLTIAVARRRDLPEAESIMHEGKSIALGVKEAKDLGNTPPNVCNPTFLADRALELKEQYPKLNVEILEEAQMRELGMGAFLSVTAGTVEPAKIISMEHRGNPDPDAAPIVLVGKGITFDSGGISLKPGAAMDEMKYDMCGAASVFGVMSACLDLNVPVNIVGIVAAAENMPASNASRPGDIVTTMAGKTVEILNTDAEGRLVLCDALTYAAKYNPDVVIDIATLTGACIIALGHVASAVMGNNATLCRELTQAGQHIDDRIWELPLWDDYRKQLKSNFADLANIGGRPAGSITAASFLSHFTEDYHWAHLDIAGTAWVSGDKKGATGRPVPLLTEYVLRRSRQQQDT